MPAADSFSESLLRSVVATLDDIVFHVDPGGIIRSWHAPLSADLYTQPSDFEGRHVSEVLPQDLAERFESVFERASASGLETLEYSLDMLGRTHWFLARVAPVEAGGWVAVIRNNTRLREYAHALEIRTSQLDSQFENLPLATFIFQSFSEGIIFQRFNVAARRLIGENITTLLGRPVSEIFAGHGDAINGFLRCLREKSSFTREMECIWPGMDATRHITADFVFVPPDMIMLHITDIDAVRRATQQARLAEFVIESAIEGIVLTDASGTIEKVNPAFSSITGYSAEEALGKNPRILKSDRHTDDFYEDMWRRLVTDGRWEGEIWNRRKNGETYPEHMIIAAIRDPNGLLRHYVSVFNDISDIKSRDERLAHQSMHDALTDLPNRNLLTDRIRYALSRLPGSGRALLPLLSIDIDHFKYINDAHGHIVGDYLITSIARRLETLLPQGAMLSRVGGDDFIVLLPPVNTSAEIMAFVIKVSTAFRDPFTVGKEEFFLTPSIGISVAPGDGDNEINLIKNAELAMYHAKKSGRNTWQFYSAEMNRDAARRIDLQGRLRKALDENQFEVWFQPIVDSGNGRVVSAEALVRWRDPERGIVSPGEFIPFLEEGGLIVPLGGWILEHAVMAAAAWQQEMPGLSLSVNIAARQFSEPDFILSIFRTIDKSGLDPGLVALEITENTIMSDRARVSGAMEQIKRMGFRISIDDFGTGYSSLAYLKRFDADYLKIDRSFVIDLPHDRDSSAIAEAVIALARSLGLTTIAEGVESEEQMHFLKERGCQRIQGYLYSRPLPLAEFLAFARARQMSPPDA